MLKHFALLSSRALSIIRTILYRLIWQSRFKHIGKNSLFNLQGRYRIEEGLYVEENVSIVVEPGALLEIGKNVYIGPGTRIKCYGGHIKIDDNVSINAYCYISGSGGIHIARDTRIGAQSILVASNHIFSAGDTPIRNQGTTKIGIKIGSDNWLGARVTILDGVTTPTRCVFAAGAVVSKPIPAPGVYGGVPAKLIKTIQASSNITLAPAAPQ